MMNPDDFRGKRPKLFAVFCRLVETNVKEFELQEKINTRAAVHFEVAEA